MVEIRCAQPDEAAWLQASFDAQMGWTKPAGYFAACCQRQQQDEIVLLVAVDGADYVGHCKIVWQPGYPYFREQGIPEIQDLNVLPTYRRQGVATQLVDYAESRISERSSWVGIGFGLYANYGPAQRMYIQRGYVPDGRGVVYQDEYVKPGTSVPVDDDLVLFLVKSLV
ncbi:GNAT family N-acetyltransferase [Phototrophicus methaneseepsis]|uniref:GNAT family N-acetyltransferase n=1 Tax=Phototrophicus methaneseepsis TaxID=2710758 RepID=A0A7S8E9C9_9CHLR|nr:GNAT family N-acetyltransferase [Phototrophicus methaneseepsis]QPC82777.1 GNAT family N-acetyltransferase [Phototrophicus methaneseepsis]